jgi:hypothetical protein
MPRLVTLTARFLERRNALGVISGPPAVAVRATIAALSRGALPGPQDAETFMPPVVRVWYRRVPGFNLWVFYNFSETALIVVTLTARPPVPLID